MQAGSGPTGLVLALALSINGIRVRLIDREVTHRVGSKGAGIQVRICLRRVRFRDLFCIQPRAMEMYRFLGVLQAIQEVSSEIIPMRKYKADGYEVDKQWDFVEHWEATPTCPYVCLGLLRPRQVLTVLQGDIIVLGQDTLEKVLREALEQRFGVVVELGTELIKFEQSSEHVTAHLRKHIKDRATTSDEVVYAQYLVGADGGRSVVRKMLGLDFIGETRSGNTMIYGDLEIAGLEKGVRPRF
jgi:2-polyprenyl-6-methoxyphenol hydroxylase-like FAD-dependent oxidoreductase